MKIPIKSVVNMIGLMFQNVGKSTALNVECTNIFQENLMPKVFTVVADSKRCPVLHLTHFDGSNIIRKQFVVIVE
jgi:hypothetical protein